MYRPFVLGSSNIRNIYFFYGFLWNFFNKQMETTKSVSQMIETKWTGKKKKYDMYINLGHFIY